MEIAIIGWLALSLVLIGIAVIAMALTNRAMEYRADEGPVYPLHNGPHTEGAKDAI